MKMEAGSSTTLHAKKQCGSSLDKYCPLKNNAAGKQNLMTFFSFTAGFNSFLNTSDLLTNRLRYDTWTNTEIMGEKLSKKVQ